MTKLNIISVLLGSLGAIYPLSVHAELSNLSGVAQVVPASVDQTVQLGMPFNAMSGQFQHYYCINNGDIDRVSENAVSVLLADQAIEVSESEIRRYLSGSVETNFDSELLDGIPGANASAGLARSLSNSETAISYSFGYQLEKAVETLTVSDINSQLSNECLDLITQASDTIQPLDDSTLQSLGTHLLTEISYGASLFVNLKISARTAAEKEEINGILYIDDNILDISGDLSALSEKTRSNTIVEVYAHQVGGEPERMPGWLSVEKGIDGNAVVARCDLNNFAPCSDVFNEIINYAKDDFEQGLVDEYGDVDRSKLARLSYHVTPLESDISDLVAYTPPEELSQHAADASGNLTEMLQAYEVYSDKQSLVENAILHSNDSYTDSYRANLYALRDKLSYAKQLLLQASTICREDFITGSNCQMAKDEMYLSSINSNLDVTPIDDAAFSGLFSSVSDMSIVHDVVFDTSGVVPRIRFSWEGSNAVSCNVELTNANGEAIISLLNTDVRGEVIVPVAEILEGREISGSLLLAVANVDCTDLLASGNIEASQSLDVFEGVDFTDFIRLVFVAADAEHYSLKLENANLYDGECFVKARFSFIDHENWTHGYEWSGYEMVDKDEPLTVITISDKDYSYYPDSHDDSYNLDISFLEMDAPYYYSEVTYAWNYRNPYKFVCMSTKVVDFNPEEYVALDLSYYSSAGLTWCAIWHTFTERAPEGGWVTVSGVTALNGNYKGGAMVTINSSDGLQFMPPLLTEIDCYDADSNSSPIEYEKTFLQ